MSINILSPSCTTVPLQRTMAGVRRMFVNDFESRTTRHELYKL
jgi:hypothetical protein